MHSDSKPKLRPDHVDPLACVFTNTWYTADSHDDAVHRNSDRGVAGHTDDFAGATATHADTAFDAHFAAVYAPQHGVRTPRSSRRSSRSFRGRRYAVDGLYRGRRKRHGFDELVASVACDVSLRPHTHSTWPFSHHF